MWNLEKLNSKKQGKTVVAKNRECWGNEEASVKGYKLSGIR